VAGGDEEERAEVEVEEQLQTRREVEKRRAETMRIQETAELN
jgi:hypothetical protein